MNILSLDWDYFMRTKKDDIAFLFPDGRELSLTVQDLIWMNHYNPKDKDKLLKIDVKKKEYNYICKLLRGISKDALWGVHESHVQIMNYLDDLVEEKVNIYNLDYHHDMWDMNDYLDCGNWVNHALRVGNVDKFVWVRDRNSGMPDKKRGIEITTDIRVLDGVKFDIVFICKSTGWSPPHLDKYFIKMVEILMKATNSTLNDFEGVMKDRWSYMEKGIEMHNKQLEEFYAQTKFVLGGKA